MLHEEIFWKLPVDPGTGAFTARLGTDPALEPAFRPPSLEALPDGEVVAEGEAAVVLARQDARPGPPAGLLDARAQPVERAVPRVVVHHDRLEARQTLALRLERGEAAQGELRGPVVDGDDQDPARIRGSVGPSPLHVHPCNIRSLEAHSHAPEGLCWRSGARHSHHPEIRSAGAPGEPRGKSGAQMPPSGTAPEEIRRGPPAASQDPVIRGEKRIPGPCKGDSLGGSNSSSHPRTSRLSFLEATPATRMPL